jgi:hypothetical protein
VSLRFSAVLAMGTVLSVSSISHATTAPNSSKSPNKPAPPGPMTIESLARVEGIFNYCATIDPNSAGKYHQVLSNIISGHSESEIRDDESSPRYTYALGVVDTEIAKLPESTALSACRNSLAGK